LKRISTIRVVGNRWSFFIGLVFRPPVIQEVFWLHHQTVGTLCNVQDSAYQ
jgi:hypothetical protein